MDHKFALPGFKDASKSASPVLTLENMPKLEGQFLGQMVGEVRGVDSDNFTTLKDGRPISKIGVGTNSEWLDNEIDLE